jgi:hypothetical protein
MSASDIEETINKCSTLYSTLILAIVVILFAVFGTDWLDSVSSKGWFYARVIVSILLGSWPTFWAMLMNQFIVGEHNPVGSLTFVGAVWVICCGLAYVGRTRHSASKPAS